MSAIYSHNPYAATAEQCAAEQQHEQQCHDDAASTTSTTDSGPAPAGTLHAAALWDKVLFIPYPQGEFVIPHDAVIPDVQADAAKGSDDELVRAFIGQLPYFVTDMQLGWLCYTFGGGNTFVFPERIMKRQPSGDRLPTGCVHAYASRRAVAEMAEGMHKRLLIDDTGVWCAQTKDQLIALDVYVTGMKKDKTRRIAHRPYDSVVVQFATSTYVPKHVASTRGLGNTTTKAADVPLSTRRSKHIAPRHSASPTNNYHHGGGYNNYYGEMQQQQPEQPTAMYGMYDSPAYEQSPQSSPYRQQQSYYGYADEQYAEPLEAPTQQWPTYHASPVARYSH